MGPRIEGEVFAPMPCSLFKVTKPAGQGTSMVDDNLNVTAFAPGVAQFGGIAGDAERLIPSGTVRPPFALSAGSSSTR